MPGETRTLTCLSCSAHRTTGCANHEPGWPDEELAGCWTADFLPGSDEREDWEQAGPTDIDDNRPTNP